MIYEYWVTKDGGTTYGLAKTTDFVRNEAQLEDYFLDYIVINLMLVLILVSL